MEFCVEELFVSRNKRALTTGKTITDPCLLHISVNQESVHLGVQ